MIMQELCKWIAWCVTNGIELIFQSLRKSIIQRKTLKFLAFSTVCCTSYFLLMWWINVQKLTNLNLVLRTTITTPVKPQISKFTADKSCQVGLTCHGGSTRERLLSESSRSYMLAFRLYVWSCRRNFPRTNWTKFKAWQICSKCR